jgi:ATP-binding cassette subfamily F protein uup
MLNRIATELIGLDGRGGAKSFQTLEQFTRHMAERPTEETPTTGQDRPRKPTGDSTRGPGRRKLSYKEQREFDAMEETILEAETEVERLETIANAPETMADHVKSSRAFESLSVAQERVKALYNRWSELEAIQSGDAEQG